MVGAECQLSVNAFFCGVQVDACRLVAGFMLFDAGLHPTLLKWLRVGSSLDRSANLGADLWQHYFRSALTLESDRT